MNTLITSLHIQYQPSLDVVWALRELGSNAIDGEERNRHLGIGEMSVDYNKRTGTLTISNEGIVVPQTALLMGMSESRGDDSCIGQFGEGLPMALLVLARKNYSVRVFNGQEKWEPVIERSSDYRNEPVLCIKRRKLRQERTAYTVEIDQVSEETYNGFCDQYLRMDKHFDPNMTAQTATGQERILLQPRYHGKIYNKGVFVCERQDIMFGYDLHGQLNRDRSFMDEWTLKRNLSELMVSCARVCGDKFVAMLSRALVDNNGVLEVSDEYSAIVYDNNLADRLASVFLDKYGADAIAVENEEQVKEANEMGHRGVVASPLVRRILGRKVGTLASLKANQDMAVKREWSLDQLNAQERSNFLLCTRLVQSAYPAARKVKFSVVTLGSETVKYLHDREQCGIRLNQPNLLDFEATLTAVVRGVLTLDNAVIEPHVIMTKIIAQLATGAGNVDTAMAVLAEA